MVESELHAAPNLATVPPATDEGLSRERFDAFQHSSREIKNLCMELRRYLRHFGMPTDDKAKQVSRRHVVPLVTILNELRERLATQFTLEEMCDSAHSTADIALEWSARSNYPFMKHGALIAEITDLANCAQASLMQTEGMDGFSNVLRRTRAFFTHYRQHERYENEMLLRAYNEDIGVGD